MLSPLRPLLVLAALLLVAVAALQFGGPTRASSVCGASPDVLTHGPRLGAVSDTGVKVWVRACAQADVSVEYKLSSEDWTAALETAPVATEPAADNTAVVSISGLQPATAYDYRLVVDGQLPAKAFDSAFTTVPAAAAPGSLSFIIGSDMHYPDPPLPDAILSAMRSRNAAFAVLAGDQMVIEQVLFLLGRCCIPQSQEDYEFAYLGMYEYPALRDFLAHTPTMMIWDDHEILDGWQQGTADPYPWARNAYEAFVNSANPFPRTKGGTYYSFEVGGVGVYVLDTKTYRSPDSVAEGPSRTMLGTQQLDDLKKWLLTSTARFKVIVSSVMWSDFALHAAYNEVWTNYETERNDLFDFIQDNNISGVILTSGDEHWAGVFKLAPWGIYEIAPAPIGVAAPGPVLNDPQVLYKRGGTSFFGLFTVDTAACPATLTVELIDQLNTPRFTLPLTEMDLGADYDLDTLPPCQEAMLGTDPYSADTDGDGCLDPKEIGPDQFKGGLRDPTNPWDYFNPSGDLTNRLDDILRVVQQYYKDAGDPAYTQTTDRTALGPEPWQLGAPDGVQRVDDILAIIAQYFHDCL